MNPTQLRQENQNTQDAMLIRMGCPLVQFDALGRVAYDDFGVAKPRTPSPVALSKSGSHIADLIDEYFRRIGPSQLKTALNTMHRHQVVSLAMSRSKLSRYFPGLNPFDSYTAPVSLSSATGDYPGFLADTLGRGVLGHYATARRSWRGWARKGAVNDYRQVDRVRLDDSPAMELLPPGASVEIMSLAENPTEQFQLARYGSGFSITRRALINDDLKELGQAAKIMADASHRTEDVLAYGVLTDNAAMADGSALFHADHANLTTGALTATSLGAATALIALQTNAAGDVLDLQPARLVVPAALRGVAESVLDSMSGAGRAVGESRMTMVSSALLDGTSAAQWYVGTDPAIAAPVEVAFLRGEEEPQVSSQIGFDTDSLTIKVTHSVAAKSLDARCIARSSGV